MFRNTLFIVKNNRRCIFLLLRELLEEFILELQIKDYSKRTLKMYKNNNKLCITYLEKELNIFNIEDVKPIHMKKYIKFLQSQGKEPSYINSLIKAFSSFFKYAVNEEIIEENPMEKVSKLKEKKVLINTFTDEEMERMVKFYRKSDYIDIRNRAIICMFADTGIRNLELQRLKNKDVHENYITIRQSKGKKDRRVPISPFLRKVLNRWIRCRDTYYKNRYMDEDTPFFLSFRFKELTGTSIERIVRLCGVGANVRSEIRCSPHTIRHYFAQAQLRNGLDVYSLSRLLGHENISITKRYLQSLQDEEIVEIGVKTSPLMNLRR